MTCIPCSGVLHQINIYGRRVLSNFVASLVSTAMNKKLTDRDYERLL